MELEFRWLNIVIGGLVLFIVFLKNVNKLLSLIKLGKKVYSNLPPGDLGWPLFGLSITFLKDFGGGSPDSFHKKIISRYGEGGIYRTHLLTRPTILVTEPEMCRIILASDSQFPTSFPDSLKRLISKDSELVDALPFQLHKPLHRITSTLLTGSEALSLHLQYVEQIAIDFLDQWASMSINKPIELALETKCLTLKLICRLIFGPIVDPHLPLFHTLYRVLTKGVYSVFPFELPGCTFYRAIKAREKISKIIKGMMEEKKKGPKNVEEQRPCLLDMVMVAKNDNGKPLLNENSIADYVLMFVMAGEDTTACTATWVMRYLAKYPEVFAKAKEEQELILKSRPTSQKGLTYEEIKQMKYLSMVINETLRITTVAFSSFREAKNDTQLNGYTIPKGWRIALWYRGIHMDPHIYANPEKFDPSRWENQTPKPATFFPFGYGYRYCCGADYAKLELNVLLHYFLLYYKMELINPDSKARYMPLPLPADNCLTRLTKVV